MPIKTVSRKRETAASKQTALELVDELLRYAKRNRYKMVSVEFLRMIRKRLKKEGSVKVMDSI